MNTNANAGSGAEESTSTNATETAASTRKRSSGKKKASNKSSTKKATASKKTTRRAAKSTDENLVAQISQVRTDRCLREVLSGDERVKSAVFPNSVRLQRVSPTKFKVSLTARKDSVDDKVKAALERLVSQKLVTGGKIQAEVFEGQRENGRACEIVEFELEPVQRKIDAIDGYNCRPKMVPAR